MNRILLWSPNYAPELTGIPPLVTDAAEWLAARGHVVEVATAVPNYPERRIHRDYRGVRWRTERCGNVVVHRSWIRVRPEERFTDKLLYEASFGTLSLRHAAPLLLRADVVLSTVPCLSAAAAAVRLARLTPGRPRVVLWIQDLVLVAARSLSDVGKAAGGVLSAARRIEGSTFRAADKIVSCSPGFVRYLEQQGVAGADVDVIYNWADLERIRPLPTAGDGPTRFLYTGNLGYTQGFEILIEAARLAGPEVEIEIVGEGNAAKYVRRLAASRPTVNVRVRPPVPNAEYPSLLGSASVHVVLQRSVSSNANFPSKIASYLASGRPVLASIAPDAAAASALRESEAAVMVAPDRPAELARQMRRLHDDPELRNRLGTNARAYAEAFFERGRALKRLEAVLTES